MPAQPSPTASARSSRLAASISASMRRQACSRPCRLDWAPPRRTSPSHINLSRRRSRAGSMRAGSNRRGELGVTDDGCLQEAAELPRKVHGHARVHRPLLVEEALSPAQPEDALVPDVGVHIEALVAVQAKADEFLRGDVIAG